MTTNNPTNLKPKIIEFLIFHKTGVCLCDLDYLDIPNQQKIINKVFTSSANKEKEHRYKLLYGMLFSMKSFIKTLSPSKNQDYINTFSTSNYKLHYVEFVNGLRFIFISDPTPKDFCDELRNIHRLFYTPLMSKNIFINQEDQIKNEIFLECVYNYIRRLNEELNKL